MSASEISRSGGGGELCELQIERRFANGRAISDIKRGDARFTFQRFRCEE
jgi:hypothetical protein